MGDTPKKHIPVSITADEKSNVTVRLKLPPARTTIIVEPMQRTEPIIHSHITDVLPEDHPRAYPSETNGIFCEACGEMVHAINNECMQTWIEFGKHAVCGGCFAHVLSYSDGVLDEKVFDDLKAAVQEAQDRG